MNILTSAELSSLKCRPCEGGMEACTLDEAKRQTFELRSNWELADGGKKLTKKLKLKDFKEAMQVVNAIADLAEEDQHHPDMHLTGYRQVRIDLTTHAIGGLSENDFILAAKIDSLCQSLSAKS